MAIKVISDGDRLMEKVSVDDNGCWNFTGNLAKNGYGQFSMGSRTDGSRTTIPAHRASYRIFVGELVPKMHIDHLCRNRRCCNPKHLEQVTATENIRRSVPYRDGEKYGATRRAKTECNNGHPLDYKYEYQGKTCRGCTTCRNKRSTAWQLAKKGI